MGKYAGSIKKPLSQIAIIDSATIAEIAAQVSTTGTPGPKGDKGDTGASGTPGAKGDTGDRGPAGSDATITKSTVESVLTGEIITHTHPASTAITPTSWGKYY